MVTINFKGKSIVQNYHLSVKYHQLVPVKEKSLTEKVSLNDNLIIHGDNLKALKALLPTYAGKIKCIYIDPPYNTGEEDWCYNDNVNNPMLKEWLGKVVDKDDLTRHDKWLCMMTPRLKLLRELLREDGVILISIDDNEQHNLRVLLDEIFGESNFVANIVWQKRTSPDARLQLGAAHDFIMVYTKNKVISKDFFNLVPLSEARRSNYKNPDNDPRGDWASVDVTGQTGHATKEQYYEIKSPSGISITPPKGRCWAISKPTFEKLIKDNRIWFGVNGKSRPRVKKFLSEVEGTTTWTWWTNQEVGHNQEATKEVKDIFGQSDLFKNPKPLRLLKRILQIAASQESLILDSFAGSGTTAHAVLDLNKIDGGNRKFILVECEDYADSITAERVRKVIKGVPNVKDEQLRGGLGGSFSYFELGDPIEMESILKGDKLPSFEELARYVFYTATGDEFDSSKVDEATNYIGESRDYQVYLFYKPDLTYLKSTALTLERAKALKPFSGKKRLVFAPTKFLNLSDHEFIERHGLKGIEFCQLPFEIYRIKG